MVWVLCLVRFANYPSNWVALYLWWIANSSFHTLFSLFRNNTLHTLYVHIFWGIVVNNMRNTKLADKFPRHQWQLTFPPHPCSHPTSSASAAEIMSVLFFRVMHFDGEFGNGGEGKRSSGGRQGRSPGVVRWVRLCSFASYIPTNTRGACR